MAGEKRYLEIRYKGEETGEWSDWSEQKELTDSLSWLNDHAGTSISAIEDFVADKTAVNSVLDEGVEDTIRDESHLYKPFAKSEMATVKLAVKLAGEDHVSYDSIEEVKADDTMLETLAGSGSAMDALDSSDTTRSDWMDAVVDSQTAMDAVAASESATRCVYSSEDNQTFFDGFWPNRDIYEGEVTAQSDSLYIYAVKNETVVESIELPGLGQKSKLYIECEDTSDGNDDNYGLTVKVGGSEVLSIPKSEATSKEVYEADISVSDNDRITLTVDAELTNDDYDVGFSIYALWLE